MDWMIALLVFLANILDDILCVFYIRRTAAGKVYQAGILSMLLTVVVAFSVINYTENSWYLILIAIGSGIGTALAIKLDKHLRKKRRKKRRKNETDQAGNTEGRMA